MTRYIAASEVRPGDWIIPVGRQTVAEVIKTTKCGMVMDMLDGRGPARHKVRLWTMEYPERRFTDHLEESMIMVYWTENPHPDSQ